MKKLYGNNVFSVYPNGVYSQYQYLMNNEYNHVDIDINQY